MASLSLKNISKVYPNGFVAVKDFNLEIQDKEFIITHGSKECLQIGFEILADYYFLSGHNVLFYYNRCDKGIICYPIIKTGKRKFHAYGTKAS